MDSILTSIKKLLGIVEEYEHFDSDIIMHINSVFADLSQLGVGPSEGFAIRDEEDTWYDFTEDNMLLQAVKSYVYLRVKVLFDSSSMGSATLAAYERQIAQWEWRLNVEAETTTKNDDDSSTSTIPNYVSGIVVDCLRLNIRSEPSSSSEVVCTLSSGTKVSVDTTKITDEWYYVQTADGNKGYCLKTNIRVYL